MMYNQIHYELYFFQHNGVRNLRREHRRTRTRLFWNQFRSRLRRVDDQRGHAGADRRDQRRSGNELEIEEEKESSQSKKKVGNFILE